MRSWNKTLIIMTAFCAMAAAPALAQGKGKGPGGGGSPGPGPGGGGPPSRNVGAPGPIAGAGLPFLLLAGGYVLVRRYRNRSKAG